MESSPPSSSPEPPYTSFKVIAPRITGGLSAVSSVLVIYLILVSDKKLSTIYHRIMFGMSGSDIMSSIAMALTSLPFPKSLPEDVIDAFKITYEHWPGTKLGSTWTCEVQGFFLMFGVYAMLAYNAMLCVYYACAIALGMNEKDIRKYEPILHFIPLLFGLSISVLPLFYDLYNPIILPPGEAVCLPFPLLCNDQSQVCIRGDYSVFKIVEILAITYTSILFIIIIISLAMVSWRVIQISRDFKTMMRFQQKLNDRQNTLPRRKSLTKKIRKHKESTQKVLVQALVYILAFVLVWIFSVIQPYELNQKDTSLTHWTGYADNIFFPMQGLFNFGIFLYYKVANFRQSNPKVPICTILRLFFTGKAMDPFFISRITLLQYDEAMLEMRELDDDEEMNLSYDSNHVSDKDEVATADRERIEEGNITFENESRLFARPRGESTTTGASSKGGLSGFDGSTSSRGFTLSGFSSRGGLSGFDESTSSHESTTACVSSRGDLSGFDGLISSGVSSRVNSSEIDESGEFSNNCMIVKDN